MFPAFVEDDCSSTYLRYMTRAYDELIFCLLADPSQAAPLMKRNGQSGRDTQVLKLSLIKETLILLPFLHGPCSKVFSGFALDLSFRCIP
jgi:hypothetical protein